MRLFVMVISFFVLTPLSQEKKPNQILNTPASYQDATSVTLTADTVINGIWNGNGRVLRIDNYRISGKGTLQNWIIDAPYQRWIFDTSITMGSAVKCYNGVFSSSWYGASPANADNWTSLQKSVNFCINNTALYTPAGDYKYSKPLNAAYLYKGAYAACKLNWYGDGDIWDGSTTLTYNGTTGYAFGIQRAKGGSIHNLRFKGQFVSPLNNGKSYFNLNDTAFKDASGRTRRGYSGIVIDPDGGRGAGGSTGLKIYDTQVDGFDILYNVSPNGVTYNADVLVFRDIRCGNGRIGFQSGQAQEKGNTITNIVAWDNLHTLVSIGNAGKVQAGSYTITGGNIAGGVIRLFDVRISGWNPFYVNGLTAESIATLGTVYSGDSRYAPHCVLNDLRIRFALPSQVGKQVLLTANPNVRLTNSTLWYYGLPGEEMWFSGKPGFEKCSFSGSAIMK
jgi:hypothetical protein